MVSKARTLPFPPFLLASENHLDFRTDLRASRRLKNVEVLMQWSPSPDKPDAETFLVLLSLREAQTLRRAMQAKACLLYTSPSPRD